MGTNIPNLYSTVIQYDRSGCCILPTVPQAGDEGKKPKGNWTKYKSERPTDKDYERWFANESYANNPNKGLGIVCGEVSDKLEVLDFDDGGSQFESWKQKIPKELFKKLTIEHTPSGGYHVYYRCDKIDARQMLARKPDGEILIETRGEGNFCKCSPSKGYELIQGDIVNIPTVERVDRISMLTAATQLNQYTKQKKATAKPASDTLQTTPVTSPVSPDNLRPGDDYNIRGVEHFRDVLKEQGWKHTGDAGDGNEYWERPGKDKKSVSATLKFIPENGKWYFCNFSSSVEKLEPEVSYSIFEAYTRLQHDGDHKESVKALGALGYGTKGTATNEAEIDFEALKRNDKVKRVTDEASIDENNEPREDKDKPKTVKVKFYYDEELISLDVPITKKEKTELIPVFRHATPDEVETKWLWENRFPFKFGLLAGQPNCGKTMFEASVLTATITNPEIKKWPDGQVVEEHGLVLVYSPEDGESDFQKRVEAGGGLWQNVIFYSGLGEKKLAQISPSLNELDVVEKFIEYIEGRLQKKVLLMILDPIQNFMPGVNANSSNEVTGALNPLLDYSKRRSEMCILITQHLNKSCNLNGAANDVNGSVKFMSMVRFAYSMYHSPDNIKDKGLNEPDDSEKSSICLEDQDMDEPENVLLVCTKMCGTKPSTLELYVSNEGGPHTVFKQGRSKYSRYRVDDIVAELFQKNCQQKTAQRPMGKPRDTDRDKQIDRCFYDGMKPKETCEFLTTHGYEASGSTVKRRFSVLSAISSCYTNGDDTQTALRKLKEGNYKVTPQMVDKQYDMLAKKALEKNQSLDFTTDTPSEMVAESVEHQDVTE